MPLDVVSTVRRNLDLGHGNFLLEIVEPAIASAMTPGQFLMIGIPRAEVLLRRPFSVCGLPGTFDDGPADGLQVLYRVVGRGTALLAALRPGAVLNVLGPLGRGFSDDVPDAAVPTIVAGGIGSAPFPALVGALRARRRDPIMLYGARTAADLPLIEWFRSRCSSLIVTTDDGSAGRRGLVTEPLREMLDSTDRDTLQVYACGPDAMLRAVAGMTRSAGVRCELSLEAHMACGFGVCLGCVVPTRDGEGEEIGYRRVCVEGPVMPAEVLAW